MKNVLLLIFAFAVHSLSAQIELFNMGTYSTGVWDEGAAEIVQYDPATKRVFFTNADANTIGVLDVSDPMAPSLITEISQDPYGAGVNSVAVFDTLVAVAVEADDVDQPGVITFWNTDGVFLGQATAGVLPDMVTFTPDGTRVLVANEGEPDDDYVIDPEGSVTIMDLTAGIENITSTEITFTDLNADREALLAEGVRIFGPGATVAQDLEPEYIAVTPDGSRAYVACQENNALIVIDLATEEIVDVVALGTKDHSLPQNGLDASNRDDAINIQSWPVKGFYLPDAITATSIGGSAYVLTANEGDSRDYGGYSEEERIGDLTLDTTVFPNAAELQADENLGRLKITLADGDIDGDGEYEELYSYGGRSFSIWDADGNLVWDSADDFERRLALLEPANFNSTNDENDSFDNRSDDKGPEPEAIEVGTIDGVTYAFIGLERIGGIMVYDITEPTDPHFVTYLNSRDFTGDLEANGSDSGVENIVFVPGASSPSGAPMLVISNEVSGTVSLIGIREQAAADFTLRILHNNDGESKLLPQEISTNRFVGGAAMFKTAVDSVRSEGTPSILLSSGDNFLAGTAFNASLNRADGGPYYDALFLDDLDYDAIAIGNHDFDFGPEVLAKMISDQTTNQAPYLSANLDFSAEPVLEALVGSGRIASRTVIDVDGEQVGVVGLITPILANISTPRGVTVDMNVAGIAQAEIDALIAEDINKIILITHLQSINNELELAGQLTGVDVIIAGGGDELLSNSGANTLPGVDITGTYPLTAQDPDGRDVYIVTTPGEYRYLGNLVLAFDDNDEVIRIEDESDVILIEGFVSDSETQLEIVDPIEEYAANLELNVIGITEVDLDGTRNSIRTQETNQGNLIADAFLWQVDNSGVNLDQNTPVVAITNGGGIRNASIIEAGTDITEALTIDMLPFGNSVVVLNPLSPDSLVGALENGVSLVENVNGRFPQIAGLSFVYDPAGPSDEGRIVEVVLDDGTIIMEGGVMRSDAPDVFVVTNGFVAGGRDGYSEFGSAGIATQISPDYQKPLFDYIVEELQGTITAEDYPEGGEGRITIGTVDVADLPDAQQVRIYPNPANNTLYFDQAVSGKIVDAIGRTVLDLQRADQVDVASLPSGIYHVVLDNGQSATINKR